MNQHHLQNLLQILRYAVEHGVVKSLEDSKVVIILEQVLLNALKEATSGDDVQGSPE